MDKPPEFLSYPAFASRAELFRPAPAERRGEILAWLCALGVGMAGIALTLRTGSAPCLTWQLLLLFALAGGMISLGNWLDRHTQLELSLDGLRYRSPLRKLSLKWDQVRALTAVPLRQGWRVHVEGEGGGFSLSTGIRMQLGPYQGPPIGFPDGERIVSLIRGMAGLAMPERRGRRWVSRQACVKERSG